MGHKIATPGDLKVKYEYVEYHKWDVDAEWYTHFDRQTCIEDSSQTWLFGITTKSDIGSPPFEDLSGGDGLRNTQQFRVTGRTLFLSITKSTYYLLSWQYGFVFNKFTVELRYPFSKSSSTIFGMLFLTSGNAWK
ncbi:MAG: hypothetical protein IPN60_19045, partial [Saprospiraceae bacterium]|nr:hypothetical protein [Candidatus Opimibacter skivensis]